MQTVSNTQDRATSFPRYMYAEPSILGNIPPRIVKDADEMKALGRGWVADYRHQDWPRTLYGPNGQKRLVTKQSEEQKLGASWSRTPPDGYVEPSNKTADDIKAENEVLKRQMLAIENEKMKAEIAAYAEKQTSLNPIKPVEVVK